MLEVNQTYKWHIHEKKKPTQKTKKKKQFPTNISIYK